MDNSTPDSGGGQPAGAPATLPETSDNGPAEALGGDSTPPASPDATLAAPDFAVAFAGRVAGARTRLADFDRVAFDPALQVTPAMAETIARAEQGPELIYHLGRNPDVARRIAGLDALSAARELGRIEAALAAPSPRRVTAAPEPARPLGGAESPRRDPASMSYDEYRRWRRGR